MNEIAHQNNATLERNPPPRFQESLSFEPAGFWVRLVAFVIDWMALGMVSFLVQLPFTVMIVRESVVNPNEINWKLQLISWILGMVVAVCYCGFFYSKKGATPGKMVLGLTVVDNRTGTYLTFWQGAGRDVIGKLVSAITLCIGYLIIPFRSDKRGLHDLLFSSCVVRRKHSYQTVASR